MSQGFNTIVSSIDWVWNVLLGYPTASFLFSIFLIILVAGYFDYESRYTFFSKKGIRGPTPLPYFGNILDFFFKVTPDREQKLYREYGSVYGTYEMSVPILVIGDPEAIKKIMVRDFAFFVDRRDRSNHPITKHFLPTLKGDEWRRARNTISPTFTSGKMKMMMSLMINCANDLTASLEKKALSGEDVDVRNVFGFYTTDVVAKCAFATETNVQKLGLNSPFMQHTMKFVSPSKMRIVLMMIPQFLIPLLFKARGGDTIDYLINVVRSIFDQRKQSSSNDHRNYKDLLQLMMESMMESMTGKLHDDEVIVDSDLGSHYVNNDCQTTDSDSGKKSSGSLSEDEVVANALLVLAAGFETTATLLTYASYSLSMHPEKQQKLREEIKTAFVSAGNVINYDNLASLKYLDAVISETLRMYPPGIFLERKCTQDYFLDIKVQGKQQQLLIKEGDVVRFPAFAIHRDPQYFPNPDKWEPERFMPENKHLLTPYTYIPFGGGPRNCIGMRFALLEAKLALAKCMLSFNFLPCDQTAKRIQFTRGGLLLRSKGMIIKAEKISAINRGRHS